MAIAPDIVDTDRTTVLLDLDSPTGSENSGFGSVVTKFAVGGSFKVTIPLEAERFHKGEQDGAFTVNARRPLGTAEWRQVFQATSLANLRLGIGRFNDLIARGGILRLVDGATRYVLFEPSDPATPYQGTELELHHAHELFRAELNVKLAIQPFMEGSEVTVSSATVENDPTDGTPDHARIFAIPGVTGDFRTPARLKVQMNAGAAVQRVTLAHRARNTRPSTFFSDYLAATAFWQCESTDRGWTIALGTDTTSTADANAAGGNMARVSHATSPLSWNKRVTATRTTSLDSLRGTWDVWVRVKANAARKFWLQMKWGLSATAEPIYSGEEVPHDVSDATSFGYVELKLGRIHIPDDPTVTISGLKIEIWTRQDSGTAANLDLDYVQNVFASQVSLISAGGSSSLKHPGTSLVTPVASPAGGTAAIPTTSIPGAITFDTTTDNAGTSPTTWAAGRHRLTFKVKSFTTSATFRALVRNHTASSDLASRTITTVIGEMTELLEVDAAGGVNYAAQVDDSSVTDLVVRSITDEFIPAIQASEAIRTDPNRYAVDYLDTSGNVQGDVPVYGGVGVMLDPGDNHVFVRCEDIALVGYSEPQSILTRDATVSATFFPRFPF